MRGIPILEIVSVILGVLGVWLSIQRVLAVYKTQRVMRTVIHVASYSETIRIRMRREYARLWKHLVFCLSGLYIVYWRQANLEAPFFVVTYTRSFSIVIVQVIIIRETLLAFRDEQNVAELVATEETAAIEKLVVQSSDTIVQKVVETHKDLKEVVLDSVRAAKEAVKEAHEAYTEANHVNVKIEDLNQRLLKQGEQIDHAESKDSLKEEGAALLEQKATEILKSIDSNTDAIKQNTAKTDATVQKMNDDKAK